MPMWPRTWSWLRSARGRDSVCVAPPTTVQSICHTAFSNFPTDTAVCAFSDCSLCASAGIDFKRRCHPSTLFVVAHPPEERLPTDHLSAAKSDGGNRSRALNLAVNDLADMRFRTAQHSRDIGDSQHFLEVILD